MVLLIVVWNIVELSFHIESSELYSQTREQLLMIDYFFYKI